MSIMQEDMWDLQENKPLQSSVGAMIEEAQFMI